MTNLLHQSCQALKDAPPMGDTEIHSHLHEVNGWQIAEGAIEKTFRFKNFHETMAFMNAVAWICHTENHHPEARLGYDHCVLRFRTHSVGGVSINDFICAAKVNSLIAFIA
jgi:4a-hydroxytetrahydrobiopterin dehydratase